MEQSHAVQLDNGKNADLAVRIDHLLFRPPAHRVRQRLLLMLFAACFLGFLAGLATLAPDFHQVSEFLPHLG